jgi:hypothetical protein
VTSDPTEVASEYRGARLGDLVDAVTASALTFGATIAVRLYVGSCLNEQSADQHAMEVLYPMMSLSRDRLLSPRTRAICQLR